MHSSYRDSYGMYTVYIPYIIRCIYRIYRMIYGMNEGIIRWINADEALIPYESEIRLSYRMNPG